MCVIPPIVADALHWNEAIGACGLFAFVAVATALLIYNNMSKPVVMKYDETMMEEFREWKTNQESRKHARKSINSALWSIIVVLYFVISFSTGAWYITWVIFLIGAAAENIIKACFDLKE